MTTSSLAMAFNTFKYPARTLFLSSLLLSLLPLPTFCRSAPISPLTDEKAEELVHEKLVAAAATFRNMPSHGLQVSYVAPTQVKDAWKLRALWVSVTGKEPSATLGSPSTQRKDLSHKVNEAASNPNETIVEEARQVPGGPDPLHHSNQPPSP